MASGSKTLRKPGTSVFWSLCSSCSYVPRLGFLGFFEPALHALVFQEVVDTVRLPDQYFFRGGQQTHAPVWPPCFSSALTTLPPAPGQASDGHGWCSSNNTLALPLWNCTSACRGRTFLIRNPPYLSLFPCFLSHLGSVSSILVSLGSLSLSLSFALSLTPKPCTCLLRGRERERQTDTAWLAATSSLYSAASSWCVCLAWHGFFLVIPQETTSWPTVSLRDPASDVANSSVTLLRLATNFAARSSFAPPE